MYRKNVPKIFLKWEYFLLLLILLKLFKNACMGTSYFAINFAFFIQKVNRKIESKLKNRGKKWKQPDKIALIKITNKRVFYVKLVLFKQCWVYFRLFMHAIVTCMKVPFSEMVKTNYLYSVCFWVFYSFSVVFALLQSFVLFSEKMSSYPSSLEYELQCLITCTFCII